MTYYHALPPLYGDTHGMPGITSSTSGGSGRLIDAFRGDIRVPGAKDIPENCLCTWVPRYPGMCNTYAYYQLKFYWRGCRGRHTEGDGSGIQPAATDVHVPDHPRPAKHVHDVA